MRLKGQLRQRLSANKATREQRIESIIKQLHQNRQLRGQDEDKASDRKTAEKIDSNLLERLKYRLNQPLIRLEKNRIEPINQYLERAECFKILDKLSPVIEAIGIIFIPIALFYAAHIYEQQQEQREIQRLQQASLERYLSQLSNILLNVQGDLRSDENQAIRTIANATTVTLLRDPNLDGNRKGQVVQFLYSLNFIQGRQTEPVIYLGSADLEGTDLRNASFMGVNLTNANLKLAIFKQTDLSYGEFKGSNLERATLEDANLRNSDLQWADLEGANLRNAVLSEAILDSAKLSNANLQNAELGSADLKNAILDSADLKGANFRRIDQADSSFWPTDLRGASLRNADLRNTDLSGVQLQKANLEGADLRNATLGRYFSDTYPTDLSGADLSNADLRGIVIGEVIIEGANLTGADLRNTSLTEQVFQEITLCNTKLPQGFSTESDRDCTD